MIVRPLRYIWVGFLSTIALLALLSLGVGLVAGHIAAFITLIVGLVLAGAWRQYQLRRLVACEYCDAVYERTAGNPFFAEEVVRSLLDEGALEVRDGRLAATERIHAAVIPGTVQEVIMARIDALDPEARRVLEVASVMGGAFYSVVLAEVVQKEHLDEILGRR